MSSIIVNEIVLCNEFTSRFVYSSSAAVLLLLRFYSFLTFNEEELNNLNSNFDYDDDDDSWRLSSIIPLLFSLRALLSLRALICHHKSLAVDI